MCCLLNVVVQRGVCVNGRTARLRPLLKDVEHNASDHFFHHP
jgi:hypothetical protein